MIRRHWAERAYAFLVAMYPRAIRGEHGTEMKLVFRDLLRDPEVRTPDLMRRVLGDMRYLIGGASLGALFGIVILAIWCIVRSNVVPFGRTQGAWYIALLFAAAGFAGRLRSGTVAAGMWTGFLTGLVSGLTVPDDYWLFHVSPFYDAFSFVAMSALETTVVIFLVAIGALLPRLPRHRHRLGRRFPAFPSAWRSDSALTT